MTIYYTDNSNWTAFRLIATFACIFIAGFAFCKLIDVVYGDDTEDPVGQCLNGNQRICDKLDIEKLIGQLDERAKQWNGDQKMCFATGELMNKFLEQNPEGRFNITVPCPPMQKQPLQEDDGK